METASRVEQQVTRESNMPGEISARANTINRVRLE
jgi:hypothetical protein